MADPITRAKNGDTSYFKRTPTEAWTKVRGGPNGDSVLSISIMNYHLHCTKVIYRRCPDLLYDQSLTFKFSPLHHAAHRDDKPSMIKFIISVADKRLYRMIDSWKNTPLQLAIDHSRLESVKLLIGVDPDHLSRVDATRGTPLLYAIRVAHEKKYDDKSVKIRRMVLEKQPDACNIRTGELGWTALHHAASKGDIGGIEDIIQFYPTSVHTVDKEGHDFLDIATKYKHSEAVRKALKKKQVWDSILKENNIQGIQKLENFKLDLGDKIMADTMTKREKELGIPPKHLVLYRMVVNHFGEIVDPHYKFIQNDQDPSHMYEALRCFLSDVSDMVHVKAVDISKENISDWEKMAERYTAMGLRLNWFPELVARYRGWFAKKREHLSHLEHEIETKEAKIEAYEKQLKELRSLQNEVREELKKLKDQRDTYTSDLDDDDPLSVVRQVIAQQASQN